MKFSVPLHKISKVVEQALLTESSLPSYAEAKASMVGRKIEPKRRNERQKLSVLKVTRDAENIFHRYRWALGIVVCPYCGSIHVTQIGNEYKYKCNSCKNRFNDKTRTLLHGSKLSVQVWMLGLYEILSTNYISSIELATKLGINQKSAWLMLSKLRYALDESDIVLCDSTTKGSGNDSEDWISMDEAYLGGCLTNYHYSRKLRLLKERHFSTDFSIEDAKKRGQRLYEKSDIYALNSSLKAPVFGMTDKGKAVLYATPNPIRKEYIREIYKGHVKGECLAVSDESRLYDGWTKEIGSPLVTNNHHNNHYITHSETLHAQVSSNRIENRFSWLKRGFGSRITHCKYHQLYLNEWCFRFNTRDMSTEDRLGRAIEKMKDVMERLNNVKEATENTTGVKRRKWARVTLALIRESVPENKRAKNSRGSNLSAAIAPDEIERMMSYGIIEKIEDGHRKYYQEDYK